MTVDCYPCRNNGRFDQLPPRELVAADAHWRAAHAVGTTLPGWLVLLPRRHVTTIADLTDGEAATLGTWQVRLSRALHAVTGCVKTYVVQFAEQQGFHHVHFHLVPRAADLPDDRRGPAVFGYLGAGDDLRLSDAAMDDVALALRAQAGGTSRIAGTKPRTRCRRLSTAPRYGHHGHQPAAPARIVTATRRLGVLVRGRLLLVLSAVLVCLTSMDRAPVRGTGSPVEACEGFLRALHAQDIPDAASYLTDWAKVVMKDRGDPFPEPAAPTIDQQLSPIAGVLGLDGLATVAVSTVPAGVRCTMNTGWMDAEDDYGEDDFTLTVQRQSSGWYITEVVDISDQGGG